MPLDGFYLIVFDNLNVSVIDMFFVSIYYETIYDRLPNLHADAGKRLFWKRLSFSFGRILQNLRPVLGVTSLSPASADTPDLSESHAG